MVAGKFEGTFIGAVNSRFGQSGRHFHGALPASAPGLNQAALQARVLGVKPQAHDVNRLADEGDRDFDASEVVQALGFGGCGCALLAANFVMVGKCPQFDAIGFGAGGQGFGGQSAVGDDRVAVEVGVKD
jgi:hypothetical protein